MEVRIDGVKGISDGLRTIFREIPNLDPRTVGDVILAAARTRVPVEIGRLRATGRAQGMSVTYTAPYAAPIHWGWPARRIEADPWLTKGAEQSVSVWTDAYADALQIEIERIL